MNQLAPPLNLLIPQCKELLTERRKDFLTEQCKEILTVRKKICLLCSEKSSYCAMANSVYRAHSVQINLVREGTGAIAAQEGSDCQIAVPAASHPVPVAESGSLLSPSAPVMELEMNGARLRISNGIDPALLTQVLQVLRSSAC